MHPSFADLNSSAPAFGLPSLPSLTNSKIFDCVYSILGRGIPANLSRLDESSGLTSPLAIHVCLIKSPFSLSMFDLNNSSAISFIAPFLEANASKSFEILFESKFSSKTATASLIPTGTSILTTAPMASN